MKTSGTILEGAWEDVLRESPHLMGKRVRLVAAMSLHGIFHLLTFNVGNFRSFAAIEVVLAGTLQS